MMVMIGRKEDARYRMGMGRGLRNIVVGFWVRDGSWLVCGWES
jgi:hypothetical protein